MTPLARVLCGVPLAGPLRLDPATPIEAVVIDSRKAGPGTLFVAVRGTRTDGHAFVAEALSAGAVAALVAPGRLPPDPRLVETPDPSAALATVSANVVARPAEHLRIAGVTGTNGKTTVAHLAAGLLEAAGEKVVRLGTCGDRIVDVERPSSFTTPFPPQLHRRLDEGRARGATCAVLEVSSHALAQGRVAQVPFTAVALSSFGRDHLDFHGDEGAYLAAKLRLAETHLLAGGVACAVCGAGAAARRFLRAARAHTDRVFSVGVETPADIVARDLVPHEAGTAALVETPFGRGRVSIPLLGAYNVENALVALVLAVGLGAPFEAALCALEHLGAPPGRLEPVRVEGVAGPRVLVDYAHTPDAVARVLAVVRPTVRGRLVAVLGCGGDRDRGKRPAMGAAAAAGADRVYATSDNPRTEDPAAILEAMVSGIPTAHRARVVREVDRARAIARAVAEAAVEDTVLVLGKGHETTQDLGDRVIPFDDRVVASEALAARGPGSAS